MSGGLRLARPRGSTGSSRARLSTLANSVNHIGPCALVLHCCASLIGLLHHLAARVTLRAA